MTNEIIRETQLHMSTQHLCVWDNGIYMYIYDWNIEKFENNEFMPWKIIDLLLYFRNKRCFVTFLCIVLNLSYIMKLYVS